MRGVVWENPLMAFKFLGCMLAMILKKLERLRRNRFVGRGKMMNFIVYM
jgi:hypothetical protein